MFAWTTVAVMAVAAEVEITDVVLGTDTPLEVGSTAVVHYTGSLTNGTVFDSSVPRKEPFAFQFGTGQVIQGWDKGLLGMRVGGKRRLVIPPELAYGDRNLGDIPPHSTLIFEVELVAVHAARLPPVAPDPVEYRHQPSGLQVADLVVGAGPSAMGAQRVRVEYTMWIAGGTLLDSSYSRMEATEFPLYGVISGFAEGIRGMNVGGVRQLIIPPDLAYGSSAKPGLPAFSTLICKVELLGIDP